MSDTESILSFAQRRGASERNLGYIRKGWVDERYIAAKCLNFFSNSSLTEYVQLLRDAKREAGISDDAYIRLPAEIKETRGTRMDERGEWGVYTKTVGELRECNQQQQRC